jgi:hypothetical protein
VKLNEHKQLRKTFISKYFNKFVYYDLEAKQVLEHRPMGALSKNIICFDSQFEFEVFQVIKARFPVNCIDFHFKLELKPKTQYSAPINYFVDFRVKTSEYSFLYIEAKGLMTKDASIKIKLLEVSIPAVRANLIICSAKPEYYFGKHYPASTSINLLDTILGEFCAKHRRRRRRSRRPV